jgi:site-specific recombinase XerD
MGNLAAEQAPRTTVNPTVRTPENLTQREIDKLMDAAPSGSRYGHRDATMILIAYRHGLRASALFARIGQRAELPFPVHPHMLRHTCGYLLANKGRDTRSLQAYLGHKRSAHLLRFKSSRRLFMSPSTKCVQNWRSMGLLHPISPGLS